MLYAKSDTPVAPEVIARRKMVIDTSKELNEQLKTYFKNLGFKVIKWTYGYKACKQDISLTFYFGMMAAETTWDWADTHMTDYRIFTKLPYTDYEVNKFYLHFETPEEAYSKLRTLLVDSDFNKMLTYKLPYCVKKF